ncbi:hypothetical protein A5780_01045 [Nocardia sp. 852002-20019_SCH5090214]|uniref:hypothetical protein n=1 Tax=Nocardia sp. 852002-20019_SCH5090214 TaxID=1834087 RepID=UPI0007E9FE1B|nr:hypothetical protein [Nocardia sp. 852002-20019_SCH5090214]OBA56400.1 hypothetical protein A5780_01045 [Nocardia sp. 852002-20019_SCH5090214]
MAEMDINPAGLRPLAQQHTEVAGVTLVQADPATAIAPGEKPPTDGKPGDKPPTDGKPGEKPPTDGKPGGKPGTDHTTGGPTPNPTPTADGVGQHYGKPIELDPPPGASPALTSFVALAETAIQTTVDLLGRGMTTPPPNVNDLLTTTVYQNLGKGEASDVYQQTLTKVRARQTYLLQMDAEVVKTSIKVKDGKDQTLRAVMADVNKLKDALKVDLRPLSKKLKAAKELKLMEQIADTLDSVCQKVSAVAEYNANMAGGGNSTNGSGQGSGSGSGSGASSGTATSGGAAQAGAGGDGGLGGLAQMLGPLAMMLPMGLMSLAPMVQQFIQNNAEQHRREEEERKEREAEQTQQNGAAPNAQAAPTGPAADPNAAPPAGAAPAATAPQPGGVTADPAVITPPAADGTAPATVAPATTPPGTSAPAVTAPSGGGIPGAPA